MKLSLIPILAAFGLSLAAAPWTWRAPLSTSNTFYDGIYTSTSYVLIGSNGTLLRSTDGSNWSIQWMGTKNGPDRITSNGTTLVASGIGHLSDGMLYYSTDDGLTWSAATFPTGVPYVGPSAWNGTEFLAIGYYNKSLHSTNGINWTAGAINQRTCTITTDLDWNGTQWQATCTNGAIIVSADGDNWTAVSSTNTNQLTALATHAGMSVAVGDSGTILTTANGTAWSLQSFPTKTSLRNVAWLNNNWQAVGYDSTLYTSPDGNTWTASVKYPDIPEAIFGKSDTSYVAGFRGMLTQRVGSSTPVTLYPTEKHTLHDIVWTGSEFITVGDSGIIQRSTNGVDWSVSSSGITTTLNCVVWTGSKLYAGGREALLTSIDHGITWTPISIPETFIVDLAWNGTDLVGLGLSGTVWKSTDGSVWSYSNAYLSSGQTIDKIAWTGSLFVVSNTLGNIYTTPDAANWPTMYKHSFAPEWFTNITTHGDSVIVTGSDSLVALSKDGGATWDSLKATTWLGVENLAWVNDRYLGAGSYGRTIFSQDLIHWTALTTNVSHDLNAFAVGNGRIVAVGSYGTIVTMELSSLQAIPVLTQHMQPNHVLMTPPNAHYDLLGRLR